MSIPKKPFFSKLNIFAPKSNIEAKPEMDLNYVATLIRNEINLQESTNNTQLNNGQKILIAQRIFTEERQKFQEDTLESSNFFKQTWLKTEKWILDPAQNKTRTILSMAMTTGATLATADVLGAATTLFGAGFKISTKIIAAVGLNTVMASNEAQEFAKKLKDWYDGLTPKQKKWLKIALATGGAAVAIMVLGPLTTMLSATNFLGRFTINEYFKDKIEESESEKEQVFSNELLGSSGQTFDINTVLNKLPELAKRVEEKEKQLKGLEWKKRIVGGAFSMGTGLLTTTIQATGVDNLPKKAVIQGIKNIHLFENTEAEEIPVHEFKTSTPDPTILEGQDGTQISNETPATSAVSTTNSENFEIPKEALVDGKNNIGITYAFKSQLEADPKLAEALGYDQAPDKVKFLAELGKKLGYIGEDGDVRVKAEGGAAYVLKIDQEGKAIVQEYQNGIASEIHKEGDLFEPNTKQGIEKDYEYYREKVIKAFEGGGSSNSVHSNAPTESSLADINGVPVERDAFLQENIEPEAVVNAAQKINPMYEEEQIRDKELLKNNEVRFASTPKLIVPSEADQMFKPTYEEIVQANATGSFQSLEGQNVNSYAINPTYGGHGSYETVEHTELSEAEISNKVELKLDNDLDKIFPKGDYWSVIKGTKAEIIYGLMKDKPETWSPEYSRLIKYFIELHNITGLEPLEKSAFTVGSHDETIEEYVNRALKEAAKQNKLDQIKIIK
jgi:hypothetical protein